MKEKGLSRRGKGESKVVRRQEEETETMRDGEAAICMSLLDKSPAGIHEIFSNQEGGKI